MKRALILFGAGASVDYRAPSTWELTAVIEKEVMADSIMKVIGGDTAFQTIKIALPGYLDDPNSVNFEHIYHCAHELLATFSLTPGAKDEYKPILFPLIANKSGLTRDALDPLCKKIVEVIIHEVSARCSNPALDLRPLANFLESIRRDYVTRIYTTNYDDFPLQAAPDLYDGFQAPSAGPRRFDINGFWHKERRDGIFHLHGSVHMGFGHPPVVEIGDLLWFDDRAEALKHSAFAGSSRSRMDGTSVLRTAVITGLEKLSRVQQRPFSHFYSMMARDAMRADVIFVVGSGLADLHLNTWLSEARFRTPQPPLLYVDYWENGFEHDTYGKADKKTIQLFHPLRVHVTEDIRGTRMDGWIISQDDTAAVWDRGFTSFLNAPDQMDRVLSRLLGAKAPGALDRLLRRIFRSV
jgi:hypothetical protein